MLRPKPQLNLHNAREYFREHLCVGDYYSEGQKVTGEWLGEGAKNLGLSGPVTEKDFLTLCEGRNPRTGDRLTQRLNTTRQEGGKLAANRRIFHDFTISPPKSVSVVALLEDTRIVAAHDQALRVAMTELEKFAETRVRKAGQQGSRSTGNIVAATFRHETSRGDLDPHLHTHCTVFNATRDAIEGRWKALQTEGMYRAQKFAENVYYHELCRALRGLGYEIENNARDFEIRGVPRQVIACFSKRHAQIDAEAKRQVAQGYDGDIGELRTRIAHEHRARKMKNSTAAELRSFWKEQLAAEERAALERLRQPTQQRETVDVRAVVSWADEHLFARRSVVNDYELKSTALARGRGENFDLAQLNQAIRERGYFHPRYEVHKLASPQNANCEGDIIRTVQAGMATRFAFCSDYQPDAGLSKEQVRAAQKILGSKDFVTLFRGGAGTGKTHTLKEVERAITTHGRGVAVLVLAPQRQQVQDLESAGLRAQTLAHALTTRPFSPYCVVILDEAGQVGVREMRDLLRAVDAVRGRLILSGDSRQHGAVSAGDALRWIEQHVPRKRAAELRSIRRQNPKLARSAEERRFIREYRAAVKQAAKGEIAESFDRLERLGCVRDLPDEPRRAAVAGEYLTALQRGERPLVVAQTWREVHAVNDAIRSVLRSAGIVGAGAQLTTFQPVDRSEAQKRDARFYEFGHAVVFLKRYGRHRKGDVCEVAGANERGVVLVGDGRQSTISYRYANSFVVAKRAEIEIAPGDRLQLKANGRSIEGARLHNGELVTVRGVERTGALVVTDERGKTKTLAPTQRLLVRGYAVTSYASQGKTADTVIFSDSGNRAATSREQWYVTISRGRKRVVVLTPDRVMLRRNIEATSSRELALEERARQESESQRWQIRRQQALRHSVMHAVHSRQEESRGMRRHL